MSGETSMLDVEPPVDVPATSGQYSVDRTRHRCVNECSFDLSTSLV